MRDGARMSMRAARYRSWLELTGAVTGTRAVVRPFQQPSLGRLELRCAQHALVAQGRELAALVGDVPGRGAGAGRAAARADRAARTTAPA